MIGDQPGGAARDVSLWARFRAWWKAWRRPRKHFFVNTRVTIFFGLVFMLDIRLIVALLIIAATLDSYTFLAGQDRAKGEAETPFWLSLKPAYIFWATLIILTPLLALLFRGACLDYSSVFVKMFGLSELKIKNSGGLCRYEYSSYVFALDSMLQMNLIISFYFINFVVQRNIFTILEFRNLDSIKKVIFKDNNSTKNYYLNSFVFVCIGVLHLYIDFGDIYDPSRIPMP